MNFFKVLFKDFDSKFQNIYFAEQVSVTASELYKFIKPIHMQMQFFFKADLLTWRLRGQSKSMFASDFRVLTPLPLACPCSFSSTPPPPAKVRSFWLELIHSPSISILVKFREKKLIISTSIFC